MQTLTFLAPATVWELDGVAYAEGSQPDGATLLIRGEQEIATELTFENVWFREGDGGITEPGLVHSNSGVQKWDYLIDASTGKLYINTFDPSDMDGNTNWLFIADAFIGWTN